MGKDPTIPDDADLLTEDLLAQPVKESEPEEPEREPSPHEQRRARRQMSLTLPSPEWKPAIAEQAREWHVRPSDFVTWCIAYAMRDIEAGRVPRPAGCVDQFRHRTGEPLELPWEPES